MKQRAEGVCSFVKLHMEEILVSGVVFSGPIEHDPGCPYSRNVFKCTYQVIKGDSCAGRSDQNQQIKHNGLLQMVYSIGRLIFMIRFMEKSIMPAQTARVSLPGRV